jgi:hypothetical protein
VRSEFVALTLTVCLPNEGRLMVHGDVQARYRPPTSLQAKVDPSRVGVRSRVRLEGPRVIPVSGAVVTTSKLAEAGEARPACTRAGASKA